MELKEIVGLAEKAEIILVEMAVMEVALKEKKDEFERILRDALPSAMVEEMLQEFTLESGTQVKIKNIVSGSLPAPGAIEKAKGDAKKELTLRLRAGLSFLRKNNAGDIIKNQIIATIPAGDDKIARLAAAELRKLKLNTQRVTTVHPQTLNSWLREAILENGIVIPQETFGLFTGTMAEFVLPKPGKPKKA